MSFQHRVAALLAAAIAATACASVVTAAAGAARQRIAIVERVSLAGGKSTFELIPLTPGRLKPDRGTLEAGGEFTGFITRDGLRIQIGSGTDNLSGAHGSFRLTGQIEHVPIDGGYYVDTGTWSLSAGTGVYAGLGGGGRYAAVVLPSNRILLRAEGFVRTAS
jgi:hypothetical protein